MSTENRDPRLLTAEQLADIEVCRGADYPVDCLLVHIDAQAERIAALEAELVRANIAHHEALVGRDKLFDEALEIRQERDAARHEAKLARLDADHHKVMRERLESFPLQRSYDALARRCLALRDDAEALIAAPDMGRAVALAEAVRRLGGGEP